MTRPLIPGSSDRTFSLASDPRVTTPSSAQVIHPAQFQRPNGGFEPHLALNGSSSATAIQAVLANDPLAGMTAKQIFFRCIWLSKESTATKLMLVCIWRFFDANARSSSMSYAQVAADCTLHENSAKRIAKDILGKWLLVGRQEGFKTGSGRQNLYHGICPPDLVGELRELKRKGKDVQPDEDILAAADAAAHGVAPGHPLGEQGATSGYPLGRQGVASGYPSDQGVTSHSARGNITGGVTLDIPLEEDKDASGADAPGAAATAKRFSGGAPSQGGALTDGSPTSTKGSPCKPSSTASERKRAAPRPKATEEQFGRFWAVYPKREGKPKAFERFMALTPEDADRAIFGAEQYAAKVKREGTEGRYVKWAQGWLSDRRFEDYADSPATPAAPADPDAAALKALVASPFGQRTLEREGREEGMKTLRARLAANKKGASDA